MSRENIKAKLRKEASIDLEASLRGAIRSMLESGYFPFQNCLTCLNFTEKTEICRLANQRPPALIIATGCNSYDDTADIPF